MIETSSMPGELILASSSPRRRELLEQLDVPFCVQPTDVDEQLWSHEPAEEYVRRMSLEKAAAGARSLVQGGKRCVLAADTTVVLGERILGKPRDREDALAMLQMLSGRTHRVLSSVAVTDGTTTRDGLSITEVSFAEIPPEACEAYWETGEPRDKAGAYGIQGRGAVFVRHIAGSYSGVVGLPLYETAELLRCFGYAPAFGYVPHG